MDGTVRGRRRPQETIWVEGPVWRSPDYGEELPNCKCREVYRAIHKSLTPKLREKDGSEYFCVCPCIGRIIE